MPQLNLVCALSLITTIIFCGCVSSKTSQTNCHDWVVEALQATESLPVNQRYQKVIEQVAKGCPDIPLRLSAGAKESLSNTGPDAKRALLVAAAPYFSKVCLPEDPNMGANQLLHICFEKEWPKGDFSGMLKNVDAVTYLYSRALKNEFEKAGIYKAYGQQLLANFLISNAGLRELNKD